MSETVSNPQTVLEPSEQPEAVASDPSEQPEAAASADLRFDLSQPVTATAMEQNAVALMDALFLDVDRMLERGAGLPLEPPVEAAPPAPQPVISLESLLSPKLSPRDLIPQPVELEQAEPASEQPSAAGDRSAKKWSPLWVAVLCSSLLLSLGILSYLFRDQVMQVWLKVLGPSSDPAPAKVTASPTDPKTKSDQDFLQYISRSLDRLSRTQTPSPQPSPVPTASAPSPTVVERVYVPVYPNAQTPAQTPAAISKAAPSSAPTTAAPASPAPAAPTVPTVPNIATANSHTLIGVLELGDRSAALFDVNGIPQRIEIGQQIGSSGWALVSVSNQEAIVRRNGEVRSIYVGQKF